MARQQAEHFAEGVRGEGGARGAGLLAPDFLAVELEDVLGFNAQQRDLFLGEAIGEEDVALFVKGAKLLGVELHGQRSLIRRRPVARLLYRYFRGRAAKCQSLGTPHSFMARCSNIAKASNRVGTASGISVASGLERAISGTIHSAARIVFSQGAKPRANPSSAR